MKKISKKLIVTVKSYLLLLLTFLAVNQVKAQIYDIDLTVEPPTYVSGATNEIILKVKFLVAQPEYADFIEFTVDEGVTLSSNFHIDEEYYECGKNHGEQFPAVNDGLANNNGNGLGWGRPGFQAGGSGCGAFQDNIEHTFRLKITTPPGQAGLIKLKTRVFGHTVNEIDRGYADATINLVQSDCMIICPDNVTIPNDPGECGATINYSASANGACTPVTDDQSGYYPLGTTKVDFVTYENTLDELRCTRYVTVIDAESPYIQCQDVEVELSSGDCTTPLVVDLGLSDNCGDLDHSLVQPKLNDVDFSLACNLGSNRYYRIYDLSQYGIQNDFFIETLELGIFESFNSPQITVNLHELNGPISPQNMILLHTVNGILPNLNQQLYDFPVNAKVEGGKVIVVEVITPLNNGSFGSIMGFNTVEEIFPTYISMPACGETLPVLVTEAFNGTESGSVIMNVHGYEEAYKLFANHPSGVLPGEAIGVGFHNLSYTVKDAAGNEASCTMTANIIGLNEGSGVLACNDTVRVAMEETCEVLITPDMVLEGDHYGCYDLYDVIVYDPNGNPIGNIVTADYVGLLLNVDVYLEEADNFCSSVLSIEDKFAPKFLCDTVTTTCAGNIFPGSGVPPQLAYNVTPEFNEIPDDQTFTTDIVIPVNGLNNAFLSDLDVSINISHTAISELSARLVGPNGAGVDLFIKPGSDLNCQGDNLDITLDDNALLNASDLDATCELDDYAASGTFKPVHALGVFTGTALNGNWILSISDDNGAANGGTINKVTLAFKQNGATVNLPIPSTAYAVHQGSNIFTVQGFDACSQVYLTYEDEVEDQDCSNAYSSIITRNWIGTDQMGNTSYCTQVIQILNNGITYLQFPPNYDDIEADAFGCTQNEDFYPGPELTGQPTGDLCEEIEITYDDLRIDICSGTFKILRNWKVYDWCSGEVIHHTQVIKVEDNEGPVVTTGIPDTVVYTDTYDCSTDVDLPDPFGEPTMILFDCREDEVTYTVGYKLAKPDGSSPTEADPWIYDDRIVLIDDGDGKYHYRLMEVPYDSTWIKYTFSDPCDNSTDAFFEIVVRDDSKPIAVCDEHTQVVLGTASYIEVDAFTFDDGSYDNCTDVEYTARRMNPACDSIDTFEETVMFCCEDIGTVQLVEFKVTDAYGNFSICMVEVEVIDKFPPLIICPPDKTLDCLADYTDLELTGYAEAADNCGIDTIYYSDSGDTDQCGNGTIVRTWYAIDVNGFVSSCNQIITIQDANPFAELDITWPADITLNECESNLIPEITGEVIVNDDFCSLVAIHYKDQKFDVVQDACIKILRKWTVIDWCHFDEDHPEAGGHWEYTQIIKLQNTDAPQFEDDCLDLELCSYGECEGDLELIKFAHDDCTPDNLLRWTHHIDYDNNGIFDVIGVQSNNASGIYPNGTHRIAWQVEDGCGNINTCEQVFVVKDCKKPTPLCYSQLATVVMQNNGMVEICAEDFDICGNCGSGSYDNCTAPEDLIFSFSADINDNCRTLTCEDIPNGESAYITLEVWVTDEAGNQDYCTVTLDLQDNEGDACEDNGPGAIVVSGNILDPASQSLAGIEVKLEDEESNIGFPRFEYTNANGAYSFSNLYTTHNYEVTPFKDSDHNLGVSTLDLIMIQRHLLGLTPLEDPLQIIAADSDNNEKISASDLLVIRNLILGKQDEFTNGQTSYRFVSFWNNFDNPADPFPFIESVKTDDFKNLLNSINYTGVKIGDVNFSSTNLTEEIVDSRSSEKAWLSTSKQSFQAGEMLNVSITLDADTPLAGSQFTIEFNDDILTLVDIQSDKDFIAANNFGWRYIDQGLLSASWNNHQPVEQGSKLFTLQFQAKSDARLDEVLKLTDRITKSEAYTDELEIMPIGLRFADGDDMVSAREYTLHQNIPNPFSEITEIYFELPEEAEATLSFFDLTGKVLMTITDHYKKGMNGIEVSKTSLNANGVIYYTLKTGSFTQTRKMIAIK